MCLGIVITLALTALTAEPALAGVVVTSTDTKLDTKQASPSTVYADADKLKVVNGTTTVIYRGDLKNSGSSAQPANRTRR